MTRPPRRIATRSVHLRIPVDVAEALDAERARLEAHRQNPPPGHAPVGAAVNFTDAAVAVWRAGLAAIRAARAKATGAPPGELDEEVTP